MASLTEQRSAADAGAMVQKRDLQSVPTDQKAAMSAVPGVLYGLPLSSTRHASYFQRFQY